jgi:hypothetical protein
MAKHTDEELADAIKNGGKATKIKVDKKMLSYSKLSDEQVKGLVGLGQGICQGQRRGAQGRGRKKALDGCRDRQVNSV